MSFLFLISKSLQTSSLQKSGELVRTTETVLGAWLSGRREWEGALTMTSHPTDLQV